MKKCKFVGHCSLFRENNDTCTKNGGMFYGWNRPSGCYYDLYENGEESKYWVK